MFTFKNDLRTFVENAFMDHIRQDARNPGPGLGGRGGQPNFGNARILGPYSPPTHP